MSRAVSTFYIKWSDQANNSPLGWRVCKPCFILLFVACSGLGRKIRKLFCFHSETKAEVYSQSCFSWEEVAVEVKVCFIYTAGTPWGTSTFDFPLELPLRWGPEQGLVLLNSFLTKVILICQAKLHELEEIDSLCLWPFNQKRIPAENRQWSKGIGVGVGRVGTDRPVAHNWFPEGKSRCGMVS